MKEMQMTAMVLTLVMATILMLMIPSEVNNDRVRNRSRWLMTSGLLLLSLQFLLQYTLGLRQQGVTQAIALNLLLFTPSAMLMTLSVINLQRQGNLLRRDWWVGIIAVAAVTVLIGGAVLADTSQLFWTETVGCFIFIAMQTYYAICVFNQLKRMWAVLADYYDEAHPGLVRWMLVGMAGMQALALTVPFGLYLQGNSLAFYGTLFVVATTYQWFSFVRYIITAEASRVRSAEKSYSGERKEESNSKTAHYTPDSQINISRWVDAKKYLRHGLTRPEVAREMGISDNQLGTWIKSAGFASFSQWMATLRIDEAKRLLRERPDYDIGTIAEMLGFERTHFHRTFKAQTGQSPTEFQRDAKI